MLLEVRIDVLIPIELTDDKIEVFVLFGRHVFHEERPGYFATLNERLEHTEHIGTPLRLVRAQRSGSVQYTRRNQPTSAAFKAIRPRQIEHTVVALAPIFEALANVGLRGAGLQAHERVGKVVVDVVQLRREVVALGFAFLANQLGVFESLVHVVRDGAHVVEEFRVDGPAFVFIKQWFADKLSAGFGDGISQQKFFAFEFAEAEAFVPNAAFIRSLGRAGEPAFVDTATMGAVRVPIIGMQTNSLAGVEERPRHPSGRESEESVAGVESTAEQAADVVAFGFVGARFGGGGHGFASLISYSAPPCRRRSGVACLESQLEGPLGLLATRPNRTVAIAEIRYIPAKREPQVAGIACTEMRLVSVGKRYLFAVN